MAVCCYPGVVNSIVEGGRLGGGGGGWGVEGSEHHRERESSRSIDITYRFSVFS